MSAFAIMRMEKVGQGRAIGKVITHLREHEKCADISKPELTYKNKVKQFYEGAFGYQDIIKKAIKKHNELSNKKLRKDASIGIDMIFTYSPEMENIIDKKGFFNAFKMFINNNFKGTTPLRVDCHYDEKTFHIHYVCLATTVQGTLSTRHFLGNKANMSKLQTDFANLCKDLGLERGRHKSDKKHKDLWQHKTEQLKKEYEKVKKELFTIEGEDFSIDKNYINNNFDR